MKTSRNEVARNQVDEERKAGAWYGDWDAQNPDAPREWMVAWREEAEKEDEAKK